MLINEILENKYNFTMTDKLIAEYFIKNKDKFGDLSARTIGETIYTSPSSIVRFTQKIGFKGFNEFKKAFVEENRYIDSHFKNINPNYPFQNKDRYVVVANKISTLYEETIKDTLTLLDHNKLQQATNVLLESNVIYICVGGDAFEAANTFRNRMIKLGKNVIVDSRMDNSFYEAYYANEKTCFIIISYSGETIRLIKVANKLREKKIPIITVTSYGENTLSNLATHVLHISTREKLVENIANFSSLISINFVLDTLYSCYFSENYDKNIKTKIHSSFENEEFRKSNNPLLNDR